MCFNTTDILAISPASGLIVTDTTPTEAVVVWRHSPTQQDDYRLEYKVEVTKPGLPPITQYVPDDTVEFTGRPIVQSFHTLDIC